MHTELSHYCLHFTGKNSDRETRSSEFSNINGWDPTYKTCILPYLRVRLISLHDSLPSLKTGMLAFTWWHYLRDKFINVSRNSDTTATGAIIYPLRENSFSQKKVTQQGSRTERTKSWIPGFQLHIETKQQQTKGAGLASALNQGQMSCRGDGWLRGEAGNGALAASQANRSPAQLHTERGTPRYMGLRRGLNLLPPFFFHLHKLFWCSSP